MLADKVAGRLLECGLSRRDILIGALLAMDDAVRSLKPEDVTPLVRLAAELTVAIIDCTTPLSTFAYSIPQWLVGSIKQDASGLGGFLWSLLSRGGQWSELLGGIEPYFSGLEELHASLSKGPFAAPTERFTELLTRAAVTADGDLDLLLAAGSGSRDQSELMSLGQVASRDADPLLCDLGTRLSRMDFVVVGERKDSVGLVGIVLGATVTLAAGKTRSDVTVQAPSLGSICEILGAPLWSPVNADFREGLNRARDAVLQLLNSISAPQDLLHRVNSLTVEVRGVLPSSCIADKSAGLPLALNIMSQLTDLALPMIAATGVFNRDLTLEPMERSMVDAKARAATQDGLIEALLACSNEVKPGKGIWLTPGNSLRVVCEELWGSRWNAWVERIRSNALEEMELAEGWSNGEWDGAFTIDNERVILATDQAARIADAFNKSQSTTVCTLAGRAQSGKTWIAEQVQNALLAKAWRVIVVRPAKGGLPRIDSLERYLQQYSTRAAGSQKTLLILDDLETDEDEEEFVNGLQSIRNASNLSILAVVRLDTGNDFNFEDINSYRATVNDEELQDFARGLVAQCPRLKNAEPCIGTAIKGSGGNLWLLVRLLDVASRHPEATAYEQLLTNYYATTLATCTPPQKRTAEKLASLSRVGIPVPEWFLDPLDRPFLRRLSATRDLGATWRFRVPVACEAIIGYSQQYQALAGSSYIRSRIAANLTAYFQRCIHEGHDEELIDALGRLRRSNAEILSAIFQDTRERLVQWAQCITDPVHVSKVIAAIQDDVNENERQLIIERLVLLFKGQIDVLTVGQLGVMLNLFRQHRLVMKQRDEESDPWQQMIGAVHKAMPTILQRQSSTTRARRILTRSAWRMHDDRIDEIVVANFDTLLKTDGKATADDYRLALELLSYADRIQGHKKTDQLFGICRNLIELATKRPGRPTTFLTHVSYLVLHMRAFGEDWETVLRDERQAFELELDRSSAWELKATLEVLVDFDRAFGVRLFNIFRSTSALRRIVEIAPPGEAAGMLSMLARLHLLSARRVLYDDDQPKEDLAKKIAERIRREGDTRGASLMLKACAYVDSSFGLIQEGFAKALCLAIGMPFFDEQFRGDRRTSVLFHLLDGLMETHLSFTPVILDSAVNTIARTIEDGNLREWAPRLALLGLAHPDMRNKFAHDLRQKVRPESLLRGMRSTRNLEALAVFHQLTAILFPDIPSNFTTRDCDRAFAALYRSDRPEVITRAAQSISLTLRRGGDEHSGTTVVHRLSRDWGLEVTNAATPGDSAETIRNLTGLDTTTAAKAVSAAAPRLWRVVEKGLQQRPTVGIELLDAIEQALPGQGSAMVKRFEAHPVWGAIVEDIAYEQDPRNQATAFHRLAELGGFPSPQKRRKVMEMWDSRFHLVSSPAALVSLLRMFGDWDIASIPGWLDRINMPRLESRLSAHATDDLEWLGALISILDYGRQTPARDRLIGILDEVKDLPERIGIYDTSRLIWLLHPIAPPVGKRLLGNTLIALENRINDPLASDEVEFLMTVGWLGRTCRLYGMALNIKEQPRWWQLFPTPPSASIWATCWLEVCGWTNDLIDRAFKKLDTPDLGLRPWAVCASLIAATEWNRLDALQSSRAQWPSAISSSFYFLAELLEAGLKSPILRTFLLQYEDELRSRITAPHLRLHPARATAERMLKELVRKHATALSQDGEETDGGIA